MSMDKQSYRVTAQGGGGVAVLLGTRPEIIKMAPVAAALEARGADYFILHTGQHYSYNLDGVFFEQLALPQPRYNLGVGSGSDVEEIAKMLFGVEGVLAEEKPSMVLVEGDTNSVLAGALAAVKQRLVVGHVEAGLRCGSRDVPEETNRILVDHCSDMLFAPTEVSCGNLLGEGISQDKIFVTGNTIVDAVIQNSARIDDNLTPREDDIYDLPRYFLATLHRQENVEHRTRFISVMEGLGRVADEYGVPVVFPMHPRSRKRAVEYGVELNSRVRLVEPVDYFGFLKLERDAELILTDSGGVQEEACILNVPCLTLRDNTERPESLTVGASVLTKPSVDSMLEAASVMLGGGRGWQNPFGDGKAAERIADAVLDYIK